MCILHGCEKPVEKGLCPKTGGHKMACSLEHYQLAKIIFSKICPKKRDRGSALKKVQSSKNREIEPLCAPVHTKRFKSGSRHTKGHAPNGDTSRNRSPSTKYLASTTPKKRGAYGGPCACTRNISKSCVNPLPKWFTSQNLSK